MSVYIRGALNGNAQIAGHTKITLIKRAKTAFSGTLMQRQAPSEYCLKNNPNILPAAYL